MLHSFFYLKFMGYLTLFGNKTKSFHPSGEIRPSTEITNYCHLKFGLFVISLVNVAFISLLELLSQFIQKGTIKQIGPLLALWSGVNILDYILELVCFISQSHKSNASHCNVLLGARST